LRTSTSIDFGCFKTKAYGHADNLKNVTAFWKTSFFSKSKPIRRFWMCFMH